MAVQLEGIGYIVVDDAATDISPDGFVLVGAVKTRPLFLGESVRDLSTGALLYWDGAALSAGT